MIQFSVEDEGPGVPDALREKIFQPWVKLTEATVSGVGLGLAISMSVVQGLNGTIGCGDRADGAPGARFWFNFPYLPVSTEGLHSIHGPSTSGGNSLCLPAEAVSGRRVDGNVEQKARKKRKAGRAAGPSVRDMEMMDDKWKEMRDWFRKQHILIVEDNIVNEKMLRALLDSIFRVRKQGKKEKELSSPHESALLEVLVSSCADGLAAVNFVKRNPDVSVVRNLFLFGKRFITSFLKKFRKRICRQQVHGKVLLLIIKPAFNCISNSLSLFLKDFYGSEYAHHGRRSVSKNHSRAGEGR